MQIIKNLKFAATAFLLSLFLQTSSTQAGGASIQIPFEKCFNPDTGFWEGPVEGACGPGNVSYQDVPPFFGTKVQHWSGVYTVTNGDCSFKAVIIGRWNTQIGLLVVNGLVTEDSKAYAGSQFHVHAEWHGEECFQATMVITPSQPE